MSNEEVEAFVDILYPYFLKKIKQENIFKKCVKRVNATVTSVDNEDNIGQMIRVSLPYDEVSFIARNETGISLEIGNLVCLEYSIDLKNAIAVYKV